MPLVTDYNTIFNMKIQQKDNQHKIKKKTISKTYKLRVLMLSVVYLI
jgi:hypothetical protein